MTVHGDPCKFPFHWKGADHTGCTWVDAVGMPWCVTEGGGRGNCNMDTCEGKTVLLLLEGAHTPV